MSVHYKVDRISFMSRFFLPDGDESVLFGAHRTRAVPDLPLRLPRNILPLQVSQLTSPWHAWQTDNSLSLHWWIPRWCNVTPFSSCRSLSCQRITLHKNLFFSFVLNSVITIIWLTAVANNQELVQRNPVSSSPFIQHKLLHVFCNYSVSIYNIIWG